MAESTGRGRGCLKYGCFGCGLLVLLPILLVAILIAVNAVTREDPEPRREAFEHTVVEAPIAPTTPGDAREPGREAVPPTATTRPGEGEVVFDVAYAEFTIVAGNPGDPVRVEADYDAAKFDLDEALETAPDGSWRYRLEFGLRRSLWLSLFGNSQNRLRLVLPPDVPIRLRGDVRMGAGIMDLGGTWIREADLSFRMGGAELDFSKPLVEPMERFSLSGRMGGGEIRALGNASPRSSSILQHMGGFDLDLSGAWRQDAEIRIRSGMGGASIRSPDRANLVIGEGNMTLGEIDVGRLPEPDPALPTVTVYASGSMGGVDVR